MNALTAACAVSAVFFAGLLIGGRVVAAALTKDFVKMLKRAGDRLDADGLRIMTEELRAMRMRWRS